MLVSIYIQRIFCLTRVNVFGSAIEIIKRVIFVVRSYTCELMTF